jgi:hypothetical protein
VALLEEEKNPLSSTTLGQFTQTKRKKKPNQTLFNFFIKNINDHMVDVT